MRKLKTFYRNNRVFCILMGVSILCLAMIMVFFAIYLFDQSKNNTYGSRLNGIESVQIDDKHKDEIINALKENEHVEKATVNVMGKIIYINVYLKDGSVDDGKNASVKAIEVITDEEKEFYDINISINKEDDETFPYMGYKKSEASIITWTKANGGTEE